MRKFKNKIRNQITLKLNKKSPCNQHNKYLCLLYNGNYTKEHANRFRKFDLSVALRLPIIFETLYIINLRRKLYSLNL